ncbi:MAG: pyridoxine 5'-phosphate synthase [Candidatus Cloacimonetes bacterium]|nr:pyridoxine 5'-phosphate synthase [Candidatus Cloacimonadota bacterium]MCF7813301.1 pyridoxine 5'-phosphate synthase [Candidatus Cloacimonadota bacterium]MCF7867376.1 pyridoxine 5'-phosphate synthase [Candidatus Cloacimonadota bacterium]MCF7882810.1 pyridoxine 5'-phosphate synthase [Candidatus Cloacimonadota bacterium]
MILLGVNIDHVATIRQARLGDEPEPIQAALLAEQHGADQITVHLREDRRHIQDKDVELLRELIHTRLNLEMAATGEMILIAKKIKPDTVTLVPEKRKELTTEGGLKLVDDHKIGIKKLKDSGIEVSVFIEPNLTMVEKAKKIGADAVELHTGKYANCKDKVEIEKEIKRINKAAFKARELGIRVVAGHGLNYHNVQRLVELDIIEEYNIGHSIISRAVFTGLAEAVLEMKTLINS